MGRRMDCKRRRLGGGGGIKFSIMMSSCERFAPMLRLPHEIIREEVLSRLPIRDLCRAKCVCKQWHRDITSPDFIKAHRRHSHQPSHGLLISATNSDHFLFYYSPLSEQHHHRQQPRGFVPRLRVPRGPPDYQWMTQVVNGLVCLYSFNRLSLFNICTGETLDLPLPYPTPEVHCAPLVDTWMYSTNSIKKVPNIPDPGAEEATNCTMTRYYFGFDPLHKAYKILSVSYMCREGCPGPGDGPCGCPYFLVPQVLSLTSGPLSSSNWRKVPHPIPFFPVRTHTLCVDGKLWWTGNENSKLCFDLTATPEHFRTICDDYPPVSAHPKHFFGRGIPSKYGGCFVVSDACLQRRTTLRLFTHSAETIYCDWNMYDIKLPLELVRRRGRSSIAPVGNLPDGDILIANDQADDSFTPVYSFTLGRNKRFLKSFKVGKFPPETASMSPRDLAVAVTCVQDNITPLCEIL